MPQTNDSQNGNDSYLISPVNGMPFTSNNHNHQNRPVFLSASSITNAGEAHVDSNISTHQVWSLTQVYPSYITFENGKTVKMTFWLQWRLGNWDQIISLFEWTKRKLELLGIPGTHLQNLASPPVFTSTDNSFLVLSKHVSEITHQAIEQSGGSTNSLPLAAADNTKPFIHSTINTTSKNEHLQAPGHFGAGYLEQPRQAYICALFSSFSTVGVLIKGGNGRILYHNSESYLQETGSNFVSI